MCVHVRAWGMEHSALINHLGLITPAIFQFLDTYSNAHMYSAHTVTLLFLLGQYNKNFGVAESY